MDWNKEFKDACLYARTAKGMNKSQKVDNETLYHIICLSVEKFTAALASMVNYIPMHSGLTFVMRELSKKMELPANFVEETKFLNSFMVYCSLDFQTPKEITQENIERMLLFLDELNGFVDKKVAFQIEV